MPLKLPSRDSRLSAVEQRLAELRRMTSNGPQVKAGLAELRRFGRPFMGSALLVFGLFWLLYALIASTSRMDDSETLPTVDFVRLAKNFELETRERKPPELPEKPETPPEVPVVQAEIQRPTNSNIEINMSLENSTQVKSNFGLGFNEGEYLPLVKVAPFYPPRAQSQGIEGWVLLEFTVTATGTTADPVVLESQPPGIFDDAAKRAILRFKYKPRVENGKAVAVPKVQHLIRFEIDKKKSG